MRWRPLESRIAIQGDDSSSSDFLTLVRANNTPDISIIPDGGFFDGRYRIRVKFDRGSAIQKFRVKNSMFILPGGLNTEVE